MKQYGVYSYEKSFSYFPKLVENYKIIWLKNYYKVIWSDTWNRMHFTRNITIEEYLIRKLAGTLYTEYDTKLKIG